MKGLTVLLVLSLVPTLHAAKLHVPADYSTIQSAILSSAQGDTVLVAPGEYEESVSFLGKSVSLLSSSGAEGTIIRVSLGDSLPVISLPAGSSAGTLIRGFTLHGGDRVRCISSTGSSPTVEECVIEHGYVYRDGGGAFFENGSPTIRNNVVRFNRTDISGGGIFVRLGVGYGTVRVEGNTCYGNQAPNGPAIAMMQGEGGVIERNVVYGNSTILGSGHPGAVFVWADSVAVVNNTIDGNGQGLTILSASHVDVRNNIITNNPLGGLELQEEVGPNEAVTCDYNDVWNNGGLDYVAASPAAHDIMMNPEFTAPQTGDFALGDQSPCRDAGDPATLVPPGGGAHVDMGAIEWVLQGNRGDCDESGEVTTADIIHLVGYVFKGGPAPSPTAAVGDVNCDRVDSGSDIICLVNYVFRSAAMPPCVW